MNALMRRILESKRQRRRELATLPFPEKVKIVEQMRETVASIRASVELPKRKASAVPKT